MPEFVEFYASLEDFNSQDQVDHDAQTGRSTTRRRNFALGNTRMYLADDFQIGDEISDQAQMLWSDLD